LLREIADGEIQLPDFQRGWVWDDEHISSLLTSIGRAFPIGAIMLLENGGEAKFKVRPVEGVDPAKATPNKAGKLILDGQQRLTSLTQVLMMSNPVQTRDEKKREVKRYYYVDIERAIEKPESLQDAIFGVDANHMLRENFNRDIRVDLSSDKKEYERFCFPCNQILNSDRWEEGLNAYDASKFGKYMQFRKLILSEFRQYDVPVIELKKDNKKAAVCLVFEKVNTGGVVLTVFELITATYAAEGVHLRDEWYGSPKEGIEGIQQRLAKQRMLREIQPNEFFQALSLLDTFERRQADLAGGKTGKQVTGISAKRETVLDLPLTAYQKWKEPLIKGFWQAAKFLRHESFFTTNDLPYRTQLVPLAAILTVLGERWLEQKVNEKLARWYWCGVLGELYGGAVETRFALDLQGVHEWINGTDVEPATVHDANFQPARLETLRTRGSAAYKGIHVLLQRDGALDFFWKSRIRDLDETDWEESQLDIHHIFPKAWCEGRGIPAKRYNSILNKTPISYRANRMIGGRAPSEYLRQLQGHKSVELDDASMDAILRTHSLNPATLRSDDFEAFIDSRRKLMIDQVGKAMGKPVLATGEEVPNDDIEEN
jgi:hypothetical protein